MLDQSFDFTMRKHSLRAGLLFEAGQWDSTQQSNANGTYTFSSLADFQAGLARTYTRRVGDPAVSATRSTRPAGTCRTTSGSHGTCR